MKSTDIRQAFIDYFKSKGHTFVPGSPVVPEHDPTLLFINAGMNQFKDVFLGEGTRDYTRAVNSQICIRVSGKHNDLEDVGKDTTHQTSFEMLGNWSFGDYYKQESIVWAWELLTQVYKIPKSWLYVTIYQDDDEAEALWKTHTDINPNRIIKCDAKDNFWEMGDVGPCGPCSEIHADLWADTVPLGHIKKTDTDLTQADLGSDRFIELWNLVFIQYNRTSDGTLVELPAKHIDTGAGLERLAGFLQGSRSNYDTDLLRPIIDKIVDITGVPYTLETGMPHRVLADHVRTLCFTIADNVRPANDGRGYVLRRLLRRALRYASKLNVHEPILVKLVDTVIDILGGHFTHLKAQQSFIKTLIQAEEESFLQTLQLGIARFAELESNLKSAGTTQIPGDEAFKLYDTYGFPLDLTQVMAEESGLTVDLEGFTAALNAQKSRSRASTKAKQSANQTSQNQTIDYSHLHSLPLHLSEYTDAIPRGGEARIITDPTDKLNMARHHTATHLLQAALQHIVGAHVNQAGSYVDTDKLRFDFTHFKALTKDELTQVEAWINTKIQDAIPLTINHMSLVEAKLAGAMALFGEKYDEHDVRVVKIGADSTELCGGTHVQNTAQIEHVKLLSDSAIAAGTRRIEAIAGHTAIRQYNDTQKADWIKKITPKLEKLTQKITELATHAPNAVTDPVTSIQPPSTTMSLDDLIALDANLNAALKQVDKDIEKHRQASANAQLTEILSHQTPLKNTDGVCISAVIDNADMKLLQTLSDSILTAQPNALIILGGIYQDKGSLLIKMASPLTTIYNAKTLLDTLLVTTNGGGGGSAQKAQAGGCEPAQLNAAITSLISTL